MKLMSAHDIAHGAERMVGQQARLAIAEMKLALGEARRVAEQPRHRVPRGLRVLQPFAEHHVAAALAVNRMALRKFRETVEKAACCRELPRMQFRIAARQPADVATGRRRFVRAAARTARSRRRRAASRRARAHRRRRTPRRTRARSAGRAVAAPHERARCTRRAARPSRESRRDRGDVRPFRQNAKAAPRGRHARSPAPDRDGAPAAPASRRAGSRPAPECRAARAHRRSACDAGRCRAC